MVTPLADIIDDGEDGGDDGSDDERRLPSGDPDARSSSMSGIEKQSLNNPTPRSLAHGE